MSLFAIFKSGEPSVRFHRQGSDLRSPLAIELDATVKEDHNYSAEKTSYSVEDGSIFSDNFRIKPRKFKLTGIFSNHPVKIVFARDQQARYINKWLDLERLLRQVTLLTIVTEIKSYENLVIVDIATTVVPGTNEAVEFTCDLEEFQTATTQDIDAPIPKAKGKAKTKDTAKTTPKPSKPTLYDNMKDGYDSGKAIFGG